MENETSSSEEENCSICLEKIQEKDPPLSCGHVFHASCLEKMTDNRCPLCRRIFREKETVKLSIFIVVDGVGNVIEHPPIDLSPPPLEDTLYTREDTLYTREDTLYTREVLTHEFSQHFGEHTPLPEYNRLKRWRDSLEDQESDDSDEENPHGDEWEYGDS